MHVHIHIQCEYNKLAYYDMAQYTITYYDITYFDVVDVLVFSACFCRSDAPLVHGESSPRQVDTYNSNNYVIYYII